MKLPYQHIMRLGPRLIEPFNPELVNPASYDITLDNTAIHRGKHVSLPFTLEPGEFILVSSEQYWRFPLDLGGQLMLKSTTGRLGINHMLAGWFDPDFHGNATMELHNSGHEPFVLKPGMRVAQMVFDMLAESVEKPYRETGRYHGQIGVTAARDSIIPDPNLARNHQWFAWTVLRGLVSVTPQGI
jgi:dCTP deaminase